MSTGRAFWGFVAACVVALLVIVGQSYLTYRAVVPVSAPNAIAAIPPSHLALLVAQMSEASSRPAPQPLDYPRYSTVQQATGLLADSEPVFLIENESGGTVFPVRSLERYELVNTTIEGLPATMSYCSTSQSAVAYWDMVSGMTTSFIPTRMYIGRNLVMRDRMTGSSWSQMLGIAVEGHLAGASLERIPVYPTTWLRVRANYPDAIVLTAGLASASPVPAPDLPAESTHHAITFGNDDRLTPTVSVVAVLDGVQATAVPKAAVLLRHLVSLDVGTKHLVAIADTRLGAVRVFDRDMDGSSVVLDAVGGMIVDRSTRSVWNEHGLCISGPLKGLRLRAVVSVDCSWSAWNGFFPNTIVYK
jgi:hypothetical protein